MRNPSGIPDFKSGSIKDHRSSLNDHRCGFWGQDSVMVCDEPATYKMTYEGYDPYARARAEWYCRHHYELMASIIREKADDIDPRNRRRAQRTMEMNNWFQHERL